MPDYGKYALEDIYNKNITTKTLMNLIIRKIINNKYSYYNYYNTKDTKDKIDYNNDNFNDTYNETSSINRDINSNINSTIGLNNLV